MRALVVLLIVLGGRAEAQGPALPTPHGPYQVGTTRFEWTDSSRIDPTSPEPGTLRQLIVQLWYPAAPMRAVTPAPYMLEWPALDSALRRDADLASLIDTYPRVTTGAALDAPLSTAERHYPVVVFSHGLGAPRALYTTFVMQLASAGYVIAAIDHPGMGLVALPDGRVAEPTEPLGQRAPPNIRSSPDFVRYAYWLTESSYLSADQRYVLDQLTRLTDGRKPGRFASHLDVTRVAFVGHSRGFVSETCAAEMRATACVNIEGDPSLPQVRVGIPIPFLTIRNPSDTFPSITAPLKLARRPSYDVVINGGNHNSVTDLFLFGFRGKTSPDDLAAAARRLRAIARYVIAFLDQTLRQRHSTLLAAPSGTDPDVVLTPYGSPP